MTRRTGAALRRLVLEVVGWAIMAAGVAALLLPGPGLLLLFIGLVVLAQQYHWAERRIEPVKRAALKTASDSVQSVLRILASVAGCIWLIGLGVVWGEQLIGAPGWWPLRESWWLPGGWGTGGTLIASGLLALGLMIYSFRRFRDRPYDPARDITPDVAEADRDRASSTETS